MSERVKEQVARSVEAGDGGGAARGTKEGAGMSERSERVKEQVARSVEAGDGGGAARGTKEARA